MTYEEAKLRIKEHNRMHSHKEPHAVYITEALKMAVEAFEKQIPKKPTGDLHSVPHYRCPTCKNAVSIYEDSPQFPCCQWCGQALDWSDT